MNLVRKGRRRSKCIKKSISLPATLRPWLAHVMESNPRYNENTSAYLAHLVFSDKERCEKAA